MYFYLRIIFIIVTLLHFAVLYFFGIAWFGTTVLFYGLVYLLGLLFIKLFKSNKRHLLLKRNWQFLVGLLLVVELVLYISIIVVPNSGIRRIFYFSEQRRTEQLRLLRFIKQDKPYLDTHFFAYEKNSSRQLKRFSYNYTHHYDRNGFRNQEPIRDKYNIVFLGDSFIEGEGAPDDSTLVALLNLKSKNNNTQIYNAGISGSNPLHAIQLYKNKVELLNLGERRVCLSFCFNDISDISLFNSKYRFLDNSSLFFNVILRKGRAYDQELIAYVKAEVDMFRNYLMEKDIELFLLYIPSVGSLYANKLEYPYHEISEFDIDIYKYFSEEIQKNNFKKHREIESYLYNFYHRSDSHFNSKGYALVSQRIIEYLYEKDISN